MSLYAAVVAGPSDEPLGEHLADSFTASIGLYVQVSQHSEGHRSPGR
jgi:hypothetical protein